MELKAKYQQRIDQADRELKEVKKQDSAHQQPEGAIIPGGNLWRDLLL